MDMDSYLARSQTGSHSVQGAKGSRSARMDMDSYLARSQIGSRSAQLMMDFRSVRLYVIIHCCSRIEPYSIYSHLQVYFVALREML